MYLAMNRFRVPQENETEFEELWLGRDSHLKDLEGFVEFHMLKGALGEDGIRLYASHTIWQSEDHFIAWTRSQAFRDAHANAGGSRKLYDGHPNFEGFSSIQEITQTTG
ncbi:MAG: antibiotic biosynthesis monooxygenase [Rhodobacteraceae bacterium]|nr:antibiotic biosynthesis monooxygenase [Paracoccaceae bacterium]